MKPVLRDHCHERPTVLPLVLVRKFHISVEMNLSPKTTCLEGLYFYGQWGGLSRQVLLYSEVLLWLLAWLSVPLSTHPVGICGSDPGDLLPELVAVVNGDPPVWRIPARRVLVAGDQSTERGGGRLERTSHIPGQEGHLESEQCTGEDKWSAVITWQSGTTNIGRTRGAVS